MRKEQVVVAYNAGVAAPAFRIELERPIYGVRIASDSEMDQCLVAVGSARAGAFSSIRNLGAATGAQLSELLTAGNVHKVSVARPLIARVPCDARQLLVYQSRAHRGMDSGQTAPQLSLELLEDPCELVAMPTARAALDAEVTKTVTGKLAYYFAVFGRRYMSVEVEQVTAAGTNLTTQLNAVRCAWDATGSAVVYREWSIMPSTSGDAQYEGEGEFDYIEVNLDLSSAGSERAVLHLRAED